MIKVWYQKLPQQPYSSWPILEVKLRIKSLAQEIAEALGFDLSKLGKPQSEGKSVSGNYQSWILPETIDTNICGSTFPVKFTVINNKDLIWPCILGEDTIFQFARLDFYKFKGYFELEFRKDLN